MYDVSKELLDQDDSHRGLADGLEGRWAAVREAVAVVERFEQELQGVRDVIEADRFARRTDLALLTHDVEECQKRLVQEAQRREAFERRSDYDIFLLRGRVEELSTMETNTAEFLDFEALKHHKLAMEVSLILNLFRS